MMERMACEAEERREEVRDRVVRDNAAYWEGFRDGVDCRSCWAFGRPGRCDECTPLGPKPRWAPERLELVVHLEEGEAWFPAVYQPMTSIFGQGCPDTYSVAFPAGRLIGQCAADLERHGLGWGSFLVKEGREWSGGRDTLTARSKARPEVGVLCTGVHGLDYRASVDYLADMARDADARNVSRDRRLAEHRLSLGLLGTRGDQLDQRYRGHVRPDQYVLSLTKVWVRDPHLS
jgi:hypothetical protein